MSDTSGSTKCPLPGCGHALSMHNESGYCRSRTTPDRQGECICDGTPSPHLRQRRTEAILHAEATAPRRYRNTDGLRGHANARKRASD